MSVCFPGAEPVRCGTEVAVGSGGADTPPTVTFPAAAAGALYTVIIVDPDAPSPAKPTRAPIIHMILSNVAAEALAAGLDLGATSGTARRARPPSAAATATSPWCTSTGSRRPSPRS